jgi:hypothetical protein
MEKRLVAYVNPIEVSNAYNRIFKRFDDLIKILYKINYF